MADPNIPTPGAASESEESFSDLFSQYERNRSGKAANGPQGLQGTVVSITADSVIVDIGYKTEGVLSLNAFQGPGEAIKPGDRLVVSIKGRNPEGYYDLSRGRIARPRDWAALERAFNDKTTISATVMGTVKGGLSVDVGVRGFLPASRSGERDAAEMEKLVGQDIRCRITKIDVADEDVVVDRRVVLEEEARAGKERRVAELAEGVTVWGTVRSLTDYGAFVDLGGVDALLHIGDIAWSRIDSPGDRLSVGQEVEVQVLRISGDSGKRRISVGMKQLQPHPWDSAGEKFKPGDRVRAKVTRLTDFGAFVELEPGIEALIHVSEMSWVKRVKKPGDLLKPGENVEAVVLTVNTGERRMGLGLKQALGDPWADASVKFPVGSVVEGTVTSLTKFGGFVELSEGIEGMIHISDITAEKRLSHPQDALKLGQVVRAQVLEVDTQRRRLRLGIKQMAPSSLDEYLAEHKEGDIVSGRLLEVSGNVARAELGEGVLATCRMNASAPKKESQKEKEVRPGGKADLSSLSSMLQAHWKGGVDSVPAVPQAVRAGEVRSFRITKLDQSAKKIEVEDLPKK
jgi:small subunit ribosomal protein S1